MKKTIPVMFRKNLGKVFNRLNDLTDDEVEYDPDYIEGEKRQITSLANKLLEEPDALQILRALSSDFESLELKSDGDIVLSR